jgi:hypothetical protein
LKPLGMGKTQIDTNRDPKEIRWRKFNQGIGSIE